MGHYKRPVKDNKDQVSTILSDAREYKRGWLDRVERNMENGFYL